MIIWIIYVLDRRPDAYQFRLSSNSRRLSLHHPSDTRVLTQKYANTAKKSLK